MKFHFGMGLLSAKAEVWVEMSYRTPKSTLPPWGVTGSAVPLFVGGT